jgi:hypothetical protein
VTAPNKRSQRRDQTMARRVNAPRLERLLVRTVNLLLLLLVNDAVVVCVSVLLGLGGLSLLRARGT